MVGGCPVGSRCWRRAYRAWRRSCMEACVIDDEGLGLRLVSAVGMLYNAGHMPWTHTHEERDDDLCLCWCGGLGGKDPAKCNRGLYRLATDTGTWTTLERGLPDEVEVRCVTLHPTQPGVGCAGTDSTGFGGKNSTC